MSEFYAFLSKLEELIDTQDFDAAYSLAIERFIDAESSCTIAYIDVESTATATENGEISVEQMYGEFIRRMNDWMDWNPPEHFDKETRDAERTVEDLVAATTISEAPLELRLPLNNLYVRNSLNSEMDEHALVISMRSLQAINRDRARSGAHVLSALNMLGISLQRANRVFLSRVVLQNVASLRRKEEPGSSSLALTLQSLATLELQNGRYELGREYIEEALKIKESHPNSSGLSIANSLKTLADYEAATGKVNLAINRLRKCLDLTVSEIGWRRSESIERGLMLAKLYQISGYSTERDQYLSRCEAALAETEKLRNSQLHSDVLDFRISASSETAKLDEIDELLSFARTLKTLNTVARVNSFLCLAKAYERIGRIAMGLNVLREAEQFDSANETLRAHIANYRSRLLIAQGSFAEALELCEIVEDIPVEADPLSETRLRRDVCISMAKAFDGLGNVSKSIEKILEALELEHEEYSLNISGASIILAGRLSSNVQRRIPSLGRLATLLIENDHSARKLLPKVYCVLSRVVGLENFGRHILHSHLGRSSLSVDEIVHNNLSLLSSSLPLEKVQWLYSNQLEARTREFTFQDLIGRTEKPIYPSEHESITIFLHVPPTWLLARITSNGEAKHYWGGDEDNWTYYILSCRNIGGRIEYSFSEVGTEECLEVAWQQIFATPTGDVAFAHWDSSLVRALTSEQDAIRRMHVVPDGRIWHFPMAALTNGGSRMCESIAISVVSGARAVELDEGRLSKASFPDVLVVGDVSHDLIGRDGEELTWPFSDLKATSEEVAFVSASFLECETLSGSEASLRRVIAALDGRPQVFHFCGHGFHLGQNDVSGTRLELFADGANELFRTGLALSGSNNWANFQDFGREPDTGILLAADVAFLDLSGTKLVFLSACETALGSAGLGEGMQGLCNAFLTAGVGAVVASLWKVPDRETLFLVQEFYQKLKEGHDSMVALQMAQRSMNRSGVDVTAWGAFSHYGVSQNISFH